MVKKSLLTASLLFCLSIAQATEHPKVAPAPNGITLPLNYKTWQLIGVSHRNDKHSLRAVLGNHIAVNAVNNHQTDPWPEGTILAKIVWKEIDLPTWKDAEVPGSLQHAEFMIKDRQKYRDTGGWGFARWLGMEQKPYGESAAFAQECFSCHQGAKTRILYLPTLPKCPKAFYLVQGINEPKPENPLAQ